MFIAVNQTISEDSITRRAPEGYRYDDPWQVAREVARGLRRLYRVWLEQEYPDALIELDKVKEGNDPRTTGVKVVVFSYARNDKDSDEKILEVLNRIHSGFDMLEIDNCHLICQ
jgi:hypothetical protein